MIKITLRLPENVHAAISESGKAIRRSLNSEIVRAIEYYIQNAPEVPEAAKEKLNEIYTEEE